MGSYDLLKVSRDWKVPDSSRRSCSGLSRLSNSTTPWKTNVCWSRKLNQLEAPWHPRSFGRERAKDTMAL